MYSIFLLVCCSCLTVYWFFVSAEQENQDFTTYRVGKKSFFLTVNERGTINPARIIPISSKISSNQAKIVWLADEGTWVRKNVLVARFDAKPFMDRLEKAEIDLNDAYATLLVAQKALSMQEEEEQGKIQEAIRKYEMAKMEATEILEGSGPLKRRILEQKLAQQKRAVNIAKLERDDQESLLDKGYVGNREFDKVEKAFLTAQENLVVAQVELKNFDAYVWPQMKSKASLLVSGSEAELQRVKRMADLMIQNKKSEVTKVERLVEMRLKEVKKAKEDIVNCDIYAPSSGILLYIKLPRNNGKRKVQVGDSVWIGQPFLQIPDTSALVLDISVREIDVAKMSRKMKVSLEVDAFPLQEFSGEVESVSILPLEDGQDSGLKTFATRIRLLGNTEKIHVGMSATAHILYRSVSDVTAIPLNAIRFRQGKTTVQLFDNDTPREQQITVGAQGSLWVEVVDGLRPGDTILLPKP